MLKSLTLAWLLLCLAATAFGAEELEFRAPAAPDGAVTAAAMRSLAERALPVYQNPDRTQFLINLSALQMVAGDYVAANATRQSLEELRQRTKSGRPVDQSIIYDLYAQARAMQVKDRKPFDQAFAQVFRKSVTPMSDLDAYTVTRWLSTPLGVFQSNLQSAFDRVRGEQRISLAQAVDLVWSYLSFEAFRSFGPVVAPLVAEDDRRRYVIDDNVLVRTPQRASISAVMVRPRSAPKPLPTLLEFTTYVESRFEAMNCAAHGYAGVVAFARGRARSPDALVPYEHDGDDARAVIDWIAKQPWSDGRVGMYGSGYSAFAAWAAAKRPPSALKALAAASPAAPGLEPASLDRVPGMPAAIWRRWLRHPTFDRYWQRMLPYADDFASIGMPVLVTTGYFDAREADAMYYYTQHLRFDPRADETLLIGPYDSEAMRRGPLAEIGGYAIDRAALVDLRTLRYQWFDHVLKGTPAPELLTGRVNYEVMGANLWRHAASLAQMANGSIRLYLDPSRAGGHFRLSGHEPSRKRFIDFQIPLEAQDDADATQPGAPQLPREIISRDVTAANSVTWVSGPLQRPMVVSGSVSGMLSFATNQRRLGLHVSLYELLPSGDYFELFAPPDDVDVSEVVVHRRRRPLVPGRRQRFEFSGERLTSVELQKDARIVLVLAVEPRTPQTAETEDRESGEGGEGGEGASGSPPERRARPPVLDVRWYGGSYVELPIERSEAQEGVPMPAVSEGTARKPATAPKKPAARPKPAPQSRAVTSRRGR
jgi:uncharacterized protein